MFTTELVSYLGELRLNNNKPWFEKNRPRYDKLRLQFTEQVDRVIAESSKFDPALAGIEASSTLFRINRDIRFSKDKSPYKDTFSAAFSPGTKKTGGPGYYLCIDADGELLVGAGIHEPPTPQLQQVRQAIAVNGAKLHAILNEPAFKKTFGRMDGEQLKTVPRDVSADHPFAEYLRYKSFTVGLAEPVEAISDAAFAGHVAGLFKQAFPLVRYLRDSLALE